MRPTIALAIADTDLHVLAHNAVRHCIDRFHVDELLIFSDRAKPWGRLPVIPTPRLGSIADYNRLITRTLAEHLRSDFVLVVQYDGFILNADQFSPHFFHYDYIGAPWPQFPEADVGNGGFSWRSRRLVQAVAALDYTDPEEAEDLFICRRSRTGLEKQGCRFAPRALASHFSVEFPAVPYPTFGFHGIFHLPIVYRHALNFLIDHLSDRVVQSRAGFLLPAIERISPPAAQHFRARMAGTSQVHLSAPAQTL